ncbi:NAD(P)-dependent oxidoreductase [Streptacidiphilus albus]|uniref:NAD(P)-dependent oxidoreductase n=1 Tax=Streptacidiphilus albus TaxID=105425 RepID=UPI00054B08EC|nr:NAD(P)-dependent oxidoreductase [Streptacidiphilus albus]
MRAALCGLGRMGAVFAAGLAAGGHDLAVWNRTPREAPAGARRAATPAEAVRGAEAVVVMVFDGPAAESVLFGPQGITEGAAPGTLIVNATTLAPEESRELGRRAEAAGLRYLEAPVLGSVPAARAGTLQVLLGGTQSDADAAEPLLEAWSRPEGRRLVGPVGSAASLKLVANLALGTALAGLHDTVALGSRLGLARADVLDVLQHGVLGPLVTGKRERLSHDAYGEADFTTTALAKDLALVLALLPEQEPGGGGPLPAARAAALLAARAAEQDGDADCSALGRTP